MKEFFNGECLSVEGKYGILHQVKLKGITGTEQSIQTASLTDTQTHGSQSTYILSLIFVVFKCLPLRVFLANSSETWLHY